MSNLGEMMIFIVKFSNFGVANSCDLARDAKLSSDIPWRSKNKGTFLVENFFLVKLLNFKTNHNFQEF
jgi:hypothetical protein